MAVDEELRESILFRHRDPGRRTTAVCISLCSEETTPLKHVSSTDSLVPYLLNGAILIGERCQIDMLSFSPFAQNEPGAAGAVVVYLNNGKTLDEIVKAIEPEIQRHKRSVWQFLTVYKDFGGIHVGMLMANIYGTGK